MRRLFGYPLRTKFVTIAATAITLTGGLVIIPVLATSITGPFVVTDNADSFSIAGIGTRSDQNAIIGVGQGVTQQVGVVGTVSGTQSYGLEGIASNTIGAPSFGVVGSSTSANGVYAYTTNPNTAGLYAANLGPATSGAAGSGIDAFTSNVDGFGVFGGNFSATSSLGAGVKRVAINTSGQYAPGVGVGGVASGGDGVIGSDAAAGTGVLGGTSSGVGVAALGTSGGFPLFVLQENAAATTPVIDAVVGASSTPILQLSTAGNLYVSGTITQGGVAVTSTPSSAGRSYGTYSMRGTEPNVEDVGQATLSNGQANVAIDPVFASTLDMRRGYHVFITPDGDTRGLYVAGKSSASFAVRESQGGRSTVAFEYRIIGYPYQESAAQHEASVRLPAMSNMRRSDISSNRYQSLQKAYLQQIAVKPGIVKRAALPLLIKAVSAKYGIRSK